MTPFKLMLPDIHQHLLDLFPRIIVVVLDQGLGSNADIVQRIVQLVGDTGSKCAHSPHLVRLHQDSLPVFQFQDHLINRNGQVGKFVLVALGRGNWRKVSRCNTFCVTGKSFDITEKAGADNRSANAQKE